MGCQQVFPARCSSCKLQHNNRILWNHPLLGSSFSWDFISAYVIISPLILPPFILSLIYLFLLFLCIFSLQISMHLLLYISICWISSWLLHISAGVCLNSLCLLRCWRKSTRQVWNTLIGRRNITRTSSPGSSQSRIHYPASPSQSWASSVQRAWRKSTRATWSSSWRKKTATNDRHTHMHIDTNSIYTHTHRHTSIMHTQSHICIQMYMCIFAHSETNMHTHKYADTHICRHITAA